MDLVILAQQGVRVTWVGFLGVLGWALAVEPAQHSTVAPVGGLEVEGDDEEEEEHVWVNQEGKRVNPGLALPVSDVVSFTLLSTIAGFALLLSLVEKLLVYDSWLENGLSNLPKNLSGVDGMGIWLGLFVKSFAAGTALFDLLLNRKGSMEPAHVLTDLFEVVALSMIVWRSEMVIATNEEVLREYSRSSNPSTVAKVLAFEAIEANFWEVLVCATIALLLSFLPAIRHIYFSRTAQQAQMRALRLKVVKRSKPERVQEPEKKAFESKSAYATPVRKRAISRISALKQGEAGAQSGPLQQRVGRFTSTPRPPRRVPKPNSAPPVARLDFSKTDEANTGSDRELLLGASACALGVGVSALIKTVVK